MPSRLCLSPQSIALSLLALKQCIRARVQTDRDKRRAAAAAAAAAAAGKGAEKAAALPTVIMPVRDSKLTRVRFKGNHT